MSDTATNDQGKTEGADVKSVQGSHEEKVTMTMAEGKQAAAPADEGPSAEKLGVTQAQFDKFFDTKSGEYNWQAHAKEAEFKAAQRGKGQEADAEEKPADDATTTEADAKAAAEKAGLDWSALETKVINDGDLGADDYEALKGIGIPEEIVKDYIGGLKERAELHVQNVMSAFGGEAGLQAAAEFAQKNYSEAEIAELEAQLADPARYKLAVDLLMSKSGRPPVERGAAISGPNAAAPGTTEVKPFASQDELTRAIQDPRYKTDPAYRQDVERRAARSSYDNNPRAHTSGL